MKLTKINLENFKSHKSSTIHPKKVTILIGPNGGGKSSFLQSLLILKKTFERNESKLRLKDDSYDFGKYIDITRFGKVNEPLSIKIDGIIPMLGLRIPSPVNAKFEYSFSMENDIITNLHLLVSIGDFHVYYDRIGHKIYGGVTHRNKEVPFPIFQISEEFFHPRISLKALEQMSDEEKSRINSINLLIDDYNEFRNKFNQLFADGNFTRNLLMERFFYVPFTRTVSSYSVQFYASADIVHKNPEKTSSALLSKISMDSKLRDNVSDLIFSLFGKTIMHRNIPNLENPEKSDVTLDVVKDRFSTALINEGTGLNQVILLLATLTNAPENSTIGIEEPELHLHPSAQSELAKIMIRLVSRYSKQVIFTTHSEHMLYPFLASIASKKEDSLSKDDLAIYYVGMDEKSQSSNAEPLEVNEYGQIKGGMKGFWDVDLKTLSEFLGEDN